MQQQGDIDFSNLSFWANTDEGYWIHKPSFEIALKVPVLFLIQLFGILGNLSIIIIILRNQLLRLQPTNWFLLNMAVSDFLSLCCVPILYFFKQKVIFRFYHLGHFACYTTPFLTVGLFLSGALSLTVVTLSRLFGIVFPSTRWLELDKTKVYIILVLIWSFALGWAAPTMVFRNYWQRQWKDYLEINCEDLFTEADSELWYWAYWVTLLSITVWIPTIIMFISYIFIYAKLRQSLKSFPSLSVQSRLARSRRRVIQMLFILLLLEIICWGPWQVFTVYDFILWAFDIKDSDHWRRQVKPILHDVKFFFIFANSAINPFVYGYGNETMQKAFRITFPWFFKEKPNYVLQRGGAGHSAFSFNKVIENITKRSSESKVAQTVILAGTAAMAPINAHGEQHVRYGLRPKRHSIVGKVAQKVARKTSIVLNKSASEGCISNESDARLISIKNLKHVQDQLSTIPSSSISRMVSFANMDQIVMEDSSVFVQPTKNGGLKITNTNTNKSWARMSNYVKRKLSPRLEKTNIEMAPRRAKKPSSFSNSSTVDSGRTSSGAKSHSSPALTQSTLNKH